MDNTALKVGVGCAAALGVVCVGQRLLGGGGGDASGDPPEGRKHRAVELPEPEGPKTQLLEVTKNKGKVGCATKGVQITALAPGGAADLAGLKQGMVLTGINGNAVASSEDVKREFGAAPNRFKIEAYLPDTVSSPTVKSH